MTFGGWPLGLAILSGLVVYIFIPFLIGYVLSFHVLKRIVSNKKGRFYIKSKQNRIIVTILFAIIGGFIGYIIFQALYGTITGTMRLAL